MTQGYSPVARASALAIFHAAIAAVDPTQLVADHLSCLNLEPVPGPAEPLLVIGAGKAAARMAAGCERALGAGGVHGEVIVADGCAVPLRSVIASPARHPLPDGRGEEATRRILDLISRPPAGAVLCLFSGGASSLLVCPRAPVTLADKIATTQLLLNCGADIQAVNIVRKHLSEAKGGGLLRRARTSMLALLLSDVVGDDPATIASGPTAPDPTTFADAWEVLRRYALETRAPASVVRLLQAGMAGEVPETVKPGSPEEARCRNLIIGRNRTALAGAARFARAQGWRVVTEDAPLQGDTTLAAHSFGERIRRLAADHSGNTPLCVLAGGETTVRVCGTGRGGRNQEFALALAGMLAGTSTTVLSAATDGVDGPTDAAGAFVDGTTLRRAHAEGVDVDAALLENDSYTVFARLGDLLRFGPTGTNVMDIKIALLPACDRGPAL